MIAAVVCARAPVEGMHECALCELVLEPRLHTVVRLSDDVSRDVSYGFTHACYGVV